MMKKAIEFICAFGREEDGVALTEYLILLGLLIGGLITAVLIAGNSLENAWTAWGTWWDTLTPTGLAAMT
jgi:pilus assembly protein Flp/PilA